MDRLSLLLLLLSTEVCSYLQFLSHPLDNIISPQKSAFLHCNVTGSPIPTISWFKVKSGQLSNGTDYILYENGTLEIINFNSNKNGQYYCVASTSFGSVRSLNAQLQVAVLYSTSTNEKSLIVEGNEPLELTCTVPQSLPSANVTWYRNDDKVISDNRIAVTLSHKLVFSYTESSDQAPYECQVKNDFVDEEHTSNRYIVSISGSSKPNPVISWIEDAVPFSQTVVAGKQAQLECFATGRSLPSYTWSKDGTTITGTERIIFSQNNRILTLNNVTPSDAGIYMCTASQGTTKLSKTANLTVLDPPVISQVFNTVTQFASLSVNVSCTAQGTPPLNWIWRNNTVLLQQSSNIKITETGFQSTLTIDSLDVHNSGIIQCIVYNDNSYSAANNDLIVQTLAPSFIKQPHDLLVLTGDTIFLPCTANSYPFPSFSWLRNDQILVIDTNRHIQSSETFNGTLLILSAVKSDSGNYKCVADTASHYVTSAPALVKVIDHPQLLSQSNDTIVIEGHNVSLKCSISTITDIEHTYLWTKDSQPLDIISPKLLLTDNGLTIHDFQNSDAGLYACLVKLRATGSVAAPVNIKLYSAFLTTVPPKPPSSPHTIITGYIRHNSTSISWSSPMDNGGLSVLGYIVQVLPVPNCSPSNLSDFNLSVSVNEITIDSLMPFTKYNISIYAKNSKGLSISSESIHLQTDQAAPSSPPRFIVVEETEEFHQLNVSWAPPPCDQRNGIIVNYTVMYLLQSSPDSLSTLTSSNNATNIILTGLQLLVYYKIQVAANTYVGKGPFSDPVISKTSRANPPNPPNKFLGHVFNCSSVILSWSPPVPRQSEPVNNLTIASSYIITHFALSTTYNISFNTSYIVTGLNESSMYTFNISATNAFGTSQAISLNVTLPECSTQTTTNTTVSSKVQFYAQDWFVYSAAGVGGALIVVILCVVLFCSICCCIWRQKEENKSSAPSPNKFHFTYPNRRSTVLDRMMQVETMSPANDTKEAEYAELNTIQAVLASESDSIGTLTSQGSSVLRSKYQYRSPMEQEVYQCQSEALDQRQAWNDKQKRKGDSSSRKDKGSVSLNRFKQTNQPTNLYAFSSQRSTSPTDTVSSFEYESQNHVLHEMVRNGLRPHGNNLVGISHQDERESQVIKNTSSASTDVEPIRISSFKRSQLPDLALMTALPSNNTSQTSSPLPVSPSPDNSLHSLSTHRDNPRNPYPYNNNNTENRDVRVQRLRHFPPSQFKSHGSHVTRPPFLPQQATISTVL